MIKRNVRKIINWLIQKRLQQHKKCVLYSVIHEQLSGGDKPWSCRSGQDCSWIACIVCIVVEVLRVVKVDVGVEIGIEVGVVMGVVGCIYGCSLGCSLTWGNLGPYYGWGISWGSLGLVLRF